MSLPPPRTVSVAELRGRVKTRLVELNRVTHEYTHWGLQLAYALLRAWHPGLGSLTVEAFAGQRLRCHLIEVRDTTGQVLWSRSDTEQVAGDQIQEVVDLFDAVLRWQAPRELPGWTPIGDTIGFYEVDLQSVPAAADPCLGALDESGRQPYPTEVVAALADLFDIWRPRIVQAVQEYARGLVEGWFQPLTDITRWPDVPAALGHPVPTGDVTDQLADHHLDSEDWMIGIGSVHGLAAGVVESLDTGESYGEQDHLHVRVGVYSEDLTAGGVTVADLATMFHGDVRLTAAMILRALSRDNNPSSQPTAVLCKFCGQPCPIGDAHRHDGGWVGDACCWDERLRATD
jgi:hypothetical protein